MILYPPPLPSPSHCPFMGKIPRPKGPPAPDDPYWLEARCRRLPSYYNRRLPDYFYLADTEAPPMETCTAAAEPSAIGIVAAGNSEAARVEHAQIEDGEEAHEDDGEI